MVVDQGHIREWNEGWGIWRTESFRIVLDKGYVSYVSNVSVIVVLPYSIYCVYLRVVSLHFYRFFHL